MAGRRQARRKEKWSLRAATLCALLVGLATVLTPSPPANAAAGPGTVPTETVAMAVLTAAERPEDQVVMPKVHTEAEPPREKPPTGPVADEYFSNAAFLGDSRTEGFSLYSGLKEGAHLFAVGATVESVFTKAVTRPDGGKAPLLDLLAETDYDRVYIMLGLNELGWVHTETYRDQYAKVIDRIREDHPEATVVLQSLPPVSAAQDAKKTYVNNRRIAVYNDVLRKLAEDKDCAYLDVAADLTGEDGCLPQKWTFDGVHLNSPGCRVWLEYLRENPV